MKKYKPPSLDQFKEIIWDFYHTHGREFAWRHETDPYKIVISEVMLQQTQTHRVTPKYAAFIEEFSSFETLASASLRDVLSMWQGLGYNRRGKFLHQLAQDVVEKYGGILPNNTQLLEQLPGIGKATAASICAFAFNSPTLFIETNIRAVFLHFFFQGKDAVHDKDIMMFVEQAVSKENAREWYYALMDYGVMLKKTMPNPSRKSKHHIRQSKFEGSDRQVRGKIIRILTEKEKVSFSALHKLCDIQSERLKKIIDGLLSENLIKSTNQIFSIC